MNKNDKFSFHMNKRQGIDRDIIIFLRHVFLWPGLRAVVFRQALLTAFFHFSYDAIKTELKG